MAFPYGPRFPLIRLKALVAGPVSASIANAERALELTPTSLRLPTICLSLRRKEGFFIVMPPDSYWSRETCPWFCHAEERSICRHDNVQILRYAQDDKLMSRANYNVSKKIIDLPGSIRPEITLQKCFTLGVSPHLFKKSKNITSN